MGHETEIEKAKDEIYKQLPACCHYRELDEIAEDRTKNALSVSSPDSLEPNKPVQKTTDEPVLISYAIRGVVLEADKKGSFKPLVGASVVWLGTNKGTSTDTSGVFIISTEWISSRLVVSYTGYTSIRY
ncbi:MAG: carboxypeptidase-like regulatory domain-containing protein [Chitinophagaceae bacterium]|nr:carboxypeptidase-like regulatory domain-containing protein [Chitinophagaceae bacterium]